MCRDEGRTIGECARSAGGCAAVMRGPHAPREEREEGGGLAWNVDMASALLKGRGWMGIVVHLDSRGLATVRFECVTEDGRPWEDASGVPLANLKPYPGARRPDKRPDALESRKLS